MTALIEIQRPTDPQLLRQAFVANFMSIEGIKCSNPEDRSTWLELLGPFNGTWDLDRKFTMYTDSNGKIKTEGVSTCGLVPEGIFRRMNVAMDALYKPYVVSSAIFRTMSFAEKQHAWISPTSGRRPEPGDYVVIGEGSKTHALSCIEWEGDTLMSIDGGQVDENNLQAVSSRSRLWQKNHNTMLGDRAVLGWVDITSLPYRDSTCQVPDGFETEDEVTMDKYSYTGGYFIKKGENNWQEWQNGSRTYTFIESKRDDKWITLYDASRNIFVSLPINGGKSYYAWGGTEQWVSLFDVNREM